MHMYMCTLSDVLEVVGEASNLIFSMTQLFLRLGILNVHLNRETTHVCTNIHTHTHTQIHMHTHKYTCTHT